MKINTSLSSLKFCKHLVKNYWVLYI
jgi:hypothetical protein